VVAKTAADFISEASASQAPICQLILEANRFVLAHHQNRSRVAM
jgi:hypothetical protein